MIKILFVCLGNICRSPTMEATLKKLVKEDGWIERCIIDSAAMNDSFIGCEADLRMREAAKARGVEIQTRAKLFEEQFLEKYDLIFAVTHEILDQLKEQAKNAHQRKKLHLATEFSDKYPKMDIPDPYYCRIDAFDLVMDMAEDASMGIKNFLSKSFF